jgi:hypothetical protein
LRAPFVDELARERAITRYALPLCVHIPIATRNEDSLERFIGRVERGLAGRGSRMALLVSAYEFPEIDERLPIWNEPGVALLRRTEQVWVHVDYRDYRGAYRRAFPDEDLTGRVLDHVVNRRVARLKRYDYVRIVPISRGANSSAGGLVEKWGVAYHSTPHMIGINAASREFVQYADLGEIVKMLDMKTGGSLQDPVNIAQALVRPRKTP